MAINRNARTMPDHPDAKSCPHRPDRDSSPQMGSSKIMRLGGLLLAVVFLLPLAACKPKTENSSPAEEAVSAPKPTPQPVVPTALQVPKESATLAVAKFAGEHLQECVAITVSLTGQPVFPDPRWLKPEQVSILCLDDYWLHMQSKGKCASAICEGTKKLTEQIALFAGKPGGLLAIGTDGKIPKRTHDALSSSLDKIKKTELVWPPPVLSSAVENGEVVRVVQCKFPNRPVLSSCLIDESGPGASLRIEHQYYSVSKSIDSDEGLKSCLKLGGKWSAADPSDSVVARERLRQHARKLGDVAQSVGGAQRF